MHNITPNPKFNRPYIAYPYTASIEYYPADVIIKEEVKMSSELLKLIEDNFNQKIEGMEITYINNKIDKVTFNFVKCKSI